MRYLGNKDSILNEISSLLESKKLLRRGLTFFDAFCGTGAVADYFKSYFNIIINDNLTWAVKYAKGRVCAPICDFKTLGFDPFEYLNSNEYTLEGFIYKNYAPKESERMYFTPENAARIDYFRKQIEYWKNRISPFTTIDDIIYNRKINAGRNVGNNSTYITKGDLGEIEVYGKTYGANKYETSLICYALSILRPYGQSIKLYEVLEGDLKELPESCLNVIQDMGAINVIPTDMKLEKRIYEGKEPNLRSPRYTYNLFNKLGNKHCALCNCEIPELIQGAHILPVAAIRKMNLITPEKRLELAIDGDNGLWLCENHHKMFDEGIITFNNQGSLLIRNDIGKRHIQFIEEATQYKVLPSDFLTDKFLWYLEQRHVVQGY